MVSRGTLSPIMCAHPHPLDDDDDVPSAPHHQSCPHPHPDDNAPSPSPSPSTTTTMCSRHHHCPCPLPDGNATLALILALSLLTTMMKTMLLISNPTVSIQAQPLISHFHQTPLSPATCLPLNRVNSSVTACVPPPPRPPEPDHSSPTQPCPFERNCLSPASTRPF